MWVDPRSLTTTLAPLEAKNRAYSLPMPFPAPVTTTTLLSNLSVIDKNIYNYGVMCIGFIYRMLNVLLNLQPVFRLNFFSLLIIESYKKLNSLNILTNRSFRYGKNIQNKG